MKSPLEPNRSVTEPVVRLACAMGRGAGAGARGAGARGAGAAATGAGRTAEKREPLVLPPEIAEDTVWERRGWISEMTWETMSTCCTCCCCCFTGAGAAATGRREAPATAEDTDWEMRGCTCETTWDTMSDCREEEEEEAS